MIVSMTGFSSRTLVLNTTPLTLTLKSVNSRFFEIKCTLPHIFVQLEPTITKLCKEKLHRGSISVYIHIAQQRAFHTTVKPAFETINSYIQAARNIQQEHALKDQLTLNTLLTLPHIFDTQETTLDESTQEQILSTISELINSLYDTRVQEGAKLAHDIGERITSIKKYLALLQPRAHEVLEQKKNKLFAELKQFMTDTNCEETTTLQKTLVYHQLDKISIHEELVRFSGHIEELQQWIADPSGEKGKKIIFFLQELSREINTVAAKCNDALISSLAINIKLELEKIQEQSQNIV